MAEIFCIYHANCSDGVGAAFSAWKHFGTAAKYLPYNYGMPLPEVPEGSVIFCLDFSFKKEVMESDWIKGKTMAILDHHVTAQEDLKGLPEILGNINDELQQGVSSRFDMTKSGAMLAWEYFHPTVMPPLLIEYIQDRDLWKFELIMTREITAYLFSEEQKFEKWLEIETMLETFEGFQSAVAQGTAILRENDKTVKMIARQAFWGEINGHKTIIVNATSTWSDVGHFLLDEKPDAIISASYYRLREGKIKWSLRSRKDFNCAEVAKSFGGGGHAQAAGMVITAEQSASIFGPSNFC